MQDPSAAPITPFTRLMITMSVMLASALQALDSTIANVAMPHMQGALSASQDQITWVLTSYVVAVAICIPFAGWAAERFGRRQVLLVSIGGFVFASACCGIAESLPQMVLARLAQGALGAALMPLSQAVILDVYPVERITRGMAIWSSGVLLAPIAGPTLGGLIADTIGWRWVFFLNVPIGLMALLGVASFVPHSRPNPSKRFDYFGFASLSLAIGLLQAMLDRGNDLDWFNSGEIRIEGCGALVAFAFFVTHTLTTRSVSFLNKRLMHDVSYLAGVTGYSIAASIMSATRALMPLLLQGLYLYSALDAGLVMSPTGLGALLGTLVYVRLGNRVEARVFAAFGFLMLAISLWQMTRYNLEPGFRDIVWPSLLLGFGLLFATLPLTTSSFATLPLELRNEGSAIFNLVRNLAGSVAISLTQSVLSRHTSASHAALAERVTAYTPYAAPPYLPAPLSLQDAAGVALINAEVGRQAAMIAFLDVFQMLLLAALAALPLLLLIKAPRHAEKAAVIAD